MTLTLASGLLGLAVSSALVGALWRRRGEPTAFPLLGVAIFVSVGILATLSVLEVSAVRDYATLFTGLDDQIWLLPAFIYSIIALGLWVIFAFQYTGRGDRMMSVTFILVGTLLLFILGPLSIDTLVGFEPALAVSNFSTFVASFVMGALSFVSLLLIIDESLRMGGYRITEAFFLGAGVLTLAIAPLAGTVTQEPIAFFSLLASTSAFFLVAVVPFSLFSALPVARVVGRERIINEFDAAVVVIDGEGTIRDINPAAEEMFDSPRTAVVGESVDFLLSQELSDGIERNSQFDHSRLADGKDAGTGEQSTVRFADGRTATVTVDPVTDARGNQFGQLLLFQDVTERRERERRLGVLNELLIGTLREQMDAVASNARDIHSTDTEPAARKRSSQSIWEMTTELLALADHVREVDRILSKQDGDELVVEASIREVADTHEITVQFGESSQTDARPEKQTDQSSYPGITAPQFSLLVETAIAALVQEPETAQLRIVTDRGSYTIRYVDDQVTDEPALTAVLSTELLGLVANHLGVTVEWMDEELRLSMPAVSNLATEYTEEAEEIPQTDERAQSASTRTRGTDGVNQSTERRAEESQ